MTSSCRAKGGAAAAEGEEAAGEEEAEGEAEAEEEAEGDNMAMVEAATEALPCLAGEGRRRRTPSWVSHCTASEPSQ